MRIGEIPHRAGHAFKTLHSEQVRALSSSCGSGLMKFAARTSRCGKFVADRCRGRDRYTVALLADGTMRKAPCVV